MRKIILAIIGITVLGASYVVLVSKLHNPNMDITASSEATPEAVVGPGGPTSWATDFNDVRKLVGFYQNVFAGKVLAERPRAEPPKGPSRTQYDVRVLYDIKGHAEGDIVVNFDSTGSPKLTLGATYLFAAIHDPVQIGPPYFVDFHSAVKTLITKDQELSDEQLKDLVLRHERTYELLNAYPNEIPFDVHVQSGRNLNAFASFSAEEKEAVFAKFQELIPSRPVPEVLPPPPEPVVLTESVGSDCRDKMDNDSDGLIDQKDPDCLVYYREDRKAFCKDNKDNDLDGLTDAADPDCAPFYPQPEPTPLPEPAPPKPAPTSTGQ